MQYAQFTGVFYWHSRLLVTDLNLQFQDEQAVSKHQCMSAGGKANKQNIRHFMYRLFSFHFVKYTSQQGKPGINIIFANGVR